VNVPRTSTTRLSRVIPSAARGAEGDVFRADPFVDDERQRRQIDVRTVSTRCIPF
jgi:hypothetical protein